jgi:hypothetical protein
MSRLPPNKAKSRTKTRLFTGKDGYDLDRQLWDWRSANPAAINVKQAPDKPLPLDMTTPSRFAKIVPTDMVSRLVEYDEDEDTEG